MLALPHQPEVFVILIRAIVRHIFGSVWKLNIFFRPVGIIREYEEVRLLHLARDEIDRLAVGRNINVLGWYVLQRLGIRDIWNAVKTPDVQTNGLHRIDPLGKFDIHGVMRYSQGQFLHELIANILEILFVLPASFEVNWARHLQVKHPGIVLKYLLLDEISLSLELAIAIHFDLNTPADSAPERRVR